jgi:protein-L-isoaspartate(D-aspartate) O-methyltransferase
MKIKIFIILLFLLFISPVLTKDFNKERKAMVKYQIKKRGIKDKKVISAMLKIPRHHFVPKKYRHLSYADHPLPIGYGQTISQPYIVALMTELLKLKKNAKVLEIGTGSGYQAAILSVITKNVYTVEIIKQLSHRAQKTIKKLKIKNIKFKIADGYYGWKKYAPYDAIIVTCAPDHIPKPLIAQLKSGGIMVVPVGIPGAYQTLWKITKKGKKIKMENYGGVSFVPLVHR